VDQPLVVILQIKILGDGPDILDETLTLFRANSFFRNFEIKSPADILLIYSTLFIQECLSILSSKPLLQGESSKLLLTHASRNFPIPGEPGFPLNAIVDPITSREDQGIPTSITFRFVKNLFTSIAI
jgi:actin related protein 2/3 complex subunit 3